jgi:hypothetical protein
MEKCKFKIGDKVYFINEGAHKSFLLYDKEYIVLNTSVKAESIFDDPPLIEVEQDNKKYWVYAHHFIPATELGKILYGKV